MVFTDFTFDDLRTKLGLTLEEDRSLYDDVPPLAPSHLLAETLKDGVPLALGINTEKARSELNIAPVLMEVRRGFGNRIGLFSGRDLNADPARGLVGVCDFILSLSPERYTLTAPLVVIAEAENLDMAAGVPQCLAEMTAAQKWNEGRGAALPRIHGVVTTGSTWRFLQLEGVVARVDSTEYHISDVGRVLGILHRAVRDAQAPAAPPGG